jgi:hypothetical protein
MKREDLKRIGLSYCDALTGENGKLAPFAKECERHENGMVTAGGPAAPAGPTIPGMGTMASIPRDCERQIRSGAFAYITGIQPRRLVVADVQKGLAVGFSMFRHDGTKRLPKDAAPGTSNKTTWGQFNLAAMHIYKIRILRGSELRLRRSDSKQMRLQPNLSGLKPRSTWENSTIYLYISDYGPIVFAKCSMIRDAALGPT